MIFTQYTVNYIKPVSAWYNFCNKLVPVLLPPTLASWHIQCGSQECHWMNCLVHKTFNWAKKIVTIVINLGLLLGRWTAFNLRNYSKRLLKYNLSFFLPL